MLLWAHILHIVAVIFYVGGCVFLDLIFTPAQNSIPPSQASVIGQKIGKYFAILAWASLLVIGASGLTLLYSLGFMSDILYTSRYGYWLVSKMLVWIILAINGAIMTLLLRPRLEGKLALPVVPEDADRKRADLIQASTLLNRLVRTNTILSLVAAVIGASLPHGGLF